MTDILTIDFQADTLVLCDTLTEWATGNGLIVCRCRFPPCPGHWTKFLQTVLVRPAGPVTARWRTLDAPEDQTVSLSGTAFHLIPADRPVRIEWDGCDAALIVALTPEFMESTVAPLSAQPSIDERSAKSTCSAAAMRSRTSWPGQAFTQPGPAPPSRGVADSDGDRLALADQHDQLSSAGDTYIVQRLASTAKTEIALMFVVFAAPSDDVGRQVGTPTQRLPAGRMPLNLVACGRYCRKRQRKARHRHGGGRAS
jgi:hypothetical protein